MESRKLKHQKYLHSNLADYKRSLGLLIVLDQIYLHSNMVDYKRTGAGSPVHFVLFTFQYGRL